MLYDEKINIQQSANDIIDFVPIKDEIWAVWMDLVNKNG
jgi:hypothetical protein